MHYAAAVVRLHIFHISSMYNCLTYPTTTMRDGRAMMRQYGLWSSLDVCVWTGSIFKNDKSFGF